MKGASVPRRSRVPRRRTKRYQDEASITCSL